MATIPRWDLNPIYPACDSEQFLHDLKKVVSLSHELEEAIQAPSCDIVQAVHSFELALDYLETLSAYSTCLLTTDTANPQYLKAVNQVEEESLVVQRLEVLFLNFLRKREAEVVDLSKEGGPLFAYRYVLSEMLEEQKHQMEPALEDLASDLARSGTDAFSRLQEAISSSATSDWDETETKTVIQLRNDAFNADREVRKKAFEKELAVWKLFEIPFAASLNGVKGTTITLDKARGYESPLARSLSQSRIEPEVLHALIATLEKNLPMFRDYLKSKAKALGLASCAFYDLFAPVGKGGRSYTFDEARAFIVKQFSLFSKEMGLFAEKAFQNNWIDAEPRKGKVGGAYDTSFPLVKQSRILSNFDGSFNGLSTLAHELGHAYHDSVVLPQSHLLRSYPMTLAETASIFSEYVVFRGAISSCSAEERFTLVEHFLQDTTQVCVDILSRFYFEKSLFEARAEGDLMADELSSLMVDAQKRTYGDGLSVYHPYMWAVKGHYYSSDLSFYNYPYAFGQLFALGIYAQKEKDGEGFAERYRSLLEKTGSASAQEVAQVLGCDLSSESFWQEGMDIIASYAQEFSNASNS
ncbi:M3 family oligoendopeptidase [Sphaerochaeta sp. PS]|uniref:M3 family oligoendopeptidase n=1 Tax=Sphaerochaeta sp. PS TaxID=3076336 RepID=UPI0028A33C56|nr:M3 family oligoendopeptidase [Sphaerochaeta sp. PS]MDT4761896.1 M3 family oligoendopeptidase [Sphaerochaeta sp. PS]